MSIPEPAVKRSTLVLTAGILWSLVGIFLFIRGFFRLLPLSALSYILIGGAVLLGILKSRLVFYKIIDKNVERIKALSPHKDKICIFAFQAIQSYLIAGFMIALGIYLRHLPFPPQYYGTLLVLIGTALLISGLKYIQAKKEL